ncbi:MAG: T9SS C-terminal target domain-containing protein [Bacteroidetes bacterium]|nr:MAG: T9SS C-terminal target domain-containing protein [Bacteroidota bacterium]
MRTLLISSLFAAISLPLSAQDAYHAALQAELQSDYGLPAGAWVLHDSEAANLDSDYWYGNLTGSDQTSAGLPFSRLVHLEVHGAGANPWDAGYGIQNQKTVAAGSVCLAVVWLRAVGGEGVVGLFAEDASTFDKELYFRLPLTGEWRRYLLPFQTDQTYAPGELTFGLHLAWQAQTIELGGLAVLDYGQAVALEDLPRDIHNDQYGGWEPDAPWRAEAAQRIETLRKADLSVRVQDAQGQPLEGVEVRVEMLRHHFAFGTAVVSRLFAGNPGHNPTYQSKLLDLDGRGHGFNWVVFENALKWPAWEQNWITTKDQTAHAVQWLRQRGILVRGHNLLWPGWNNLPPDLPAHANDPAYLRNRIFAHIEEIVHYPGIEGNLHEWDVLNEITTNRDLEFALQGQPGYPTGRELYVEVFDKLAQEDPQTRTFVNDFVTISQGNTGGGLYDLKKQFIQELLDAGVRLDGIGFQGHIGAFPNSIYEVQATLDDFYATFGLPAKITEYDTHPDMGDAVAAAYLRDFLTLVFSHPAMEGFLMWGFWDGAHWKDNAPLFNLDWSLKPAGQAFLDLVFDQWWTDTTALTNAQGTARVRGFQGTYRITCSFQGKSFSDTLELLQDTLLVKELEDFTSAAGEAQPPAFRLFPNPARQTLRVEWGGGGAGTLRLFDVQGRPVLERPVAGGKAELSLPIEAGVYLAVLEVGGRRYARRLVRVAGD